MRMDTVNPSPRTGAPIPDMRADTTRHGAAPRVCMHVLGVARTDARVMREAVALARAGYAVSIVDVERDRDRPREEVVDGVRLKHIVMPSWFVPVRFKPWFLVKFARMLIAGAARALSEPADVYHAHDDQALPACSLAARIRRKRLVFDAHELPLVSPLQARWPKLHAMAVRALRFQIARCAAVITVSPPIVPELRRLFGGPEAVVVRNIPAFQRPAASDRIRRQLGLSAQTRIALYQGYLLDNRWLDGLARSARYLDPGNVIVVLGSGPLRPELEALIAREGVGDRIRLIAAVPYAELLEWTVSADLGLTLFSSDYSPNTHMTLPNKLFEYLMAGLPILTSQLPAIVEIVRTYDVGAVVPALEPETVGRAINAMLANDEALRHWRENARAACERELRWDVEARRLTDLYHTLLNHRTPGAAQPDTATARAAQTR